MTGRLLLCADVDPETARCVGAQLAGLMPAGQVTILSVYAPHDVPLNPLSAVAEAVLHVPEELEAADRSAALAAAEAAAEPLAEAGWQIDIRAERDARPAWSAALDTADDIDAEVIVAGAGHRHFARHGSLGREARALAHRSRRPLLVLPTPAPDDASGPVLVAFDGSPASDHALDAAASVLGPRTAVVATAWLPLVNAAALAAAAAPGAIVAAGARELDEVARRSATETAAAGAARLTASGWTTTHIDVEATASAWPALVSAADDADASLIVAGSRGHSRLAAALIGSVAEGLLRHAERPVLLVPPPAAP